MTTKRVADGFEFEILIIEVDLGLRISDGLAHHSSFTEQDLGVGGHVRF